MRKRVGPCDHGENRAVALKPAAQAAAQPHCEGERGRTPFTKLAVESTLYKNTPHLQHE